MSFLSKVLFMNARKVTGIDTGSSESGGSTNTPVTKENLLKINYEPFDSSTNTAGVIFSDYATGDSNAKTITHTVDGFSSSSAYVWTGFTIGKTYKYSAKIDGDFENTFLRVKCLNKLNKAIADTGDNNLGVASVSFTVVANTKKLQVFVGTGTCHKGSTTFSDIRLEEV